MDPLVPNYPLRGASPLHRLCNVCVQTLRVGKAFKFGGWGRAGGLSTTEQKWLHTHIHIYIYTHTYMHTHIHIYMYIHM